MEFHPSLQCLITYSLILSFLGLPKFAVHQFEQSQDFLSYHHSLCAVCKSYPIKDRIMGNTSHSLNGSESLGIKGHFYTQLFNIRTITRRTGAISKLTATLTAEITLFSLTMTIFHYFMALTIRTIHLSIKF